MMNQETQMMIHKAISRGDFSMFQAPSELVKWLIDSKICEDAKTARKWMNTKIPKEKVYQKKIIEHLKSLKSIKCVDYLFCWKEQSGPYQIQGLPDVFALIKTDEKSMLFGFEVKRPLVGKPSELQIQTINQIRQAGGVAEIVTYPFEIDDILKRYNMLKKENDEHDRDTLHM